MSEISFRPEDLNQPKTETTPKQRGNIVSYRVMVILMLLLIGSLASSVLTFFTLLITGKSSIFMSMSGDGSQGEHMGEWFMVGASVVIFSFFTLGYILPLGRRNWRSAGMSQAFIIALFTEMFGIPLTVYAVSGVLGGAFKLGHSDHLLARGIASLIGANMANTVVFIMALSLIILIFALILIFMGWKEIYNSRGELVISGIYRRLRHPQYAGIFLFILAWLVQWPTIITVIMAPLLLFTYYRLARREEEELKKQFGDEYISYKRVTPMFIPRLLLRTSQSNNAPKVMEK